MSNTENTSRRKLQRFNVSLRPFARDKRLDFVDHVCGVLAESRFGTGSFYQPISVYSVSGGMPAMVGSEMPDEFFDITEQLRMHAHEIRPVSLRGSKHIDVGSGRIGASSYGDTGELYFLDLLVTTPLVLARGSPLVSRRVTRFSFATLRLCGKLFAVFRNLKQAEFRNFLPSCKAAKFGNNASISHSHSKESVPSSLRLCVFAGTLRSLSKVETSRNQKILAKLRSRKVWKSFQHLCGNLSEPYES